MGRPHRTRAAALTLSLLVLGAGGLVACSSSDDGPKRTLQAFLNGWRSGQLDQVGLINPTGEKVPSADVVREIRALSGRLADRQPELKIVGDPAVVKDLATATVEVAWPLPGNAVWNYRTTVRLTGGDGKWQVIWEPAVVHDQLTPDDELVVRRAPADRASILDAADAPIVAPRDVMVVGVQPSLVRNIKTLVADLSAALRSVAVTVDLADLPARVTAAKPEAFVEVVTLRKPAYEKIKPRIHPLPGTVFRSGKRDLAPTRAFARALLGTVDEAQKADLDARPEVYSAGDMVGHGGLQGRYDERLRGMPGQRVLIARKAPDGTVNETQIHQALPQPGAPVKTTIEPRVQLAADAALTGQPLRTALVAVRVGDGAVLAAANGPDGGGENLAFTARVPPGSTFKMVSALGLLDAGVVGPDDPAPCPKNVTVGGRTFKNSNNFALDRVAFRVDFAKSCNTAFAALAERLGPDGLATAGRSVGIGVPGDIGVDAFSGTVSTGGPPAERAAAAFGQGTTVVSPLALAAAAATVAGGQWRRPTVLRDPVPATPAPASEPLRATSVRALQTMMREVVTVGTATPLSKVPGLPVYGKTGTAEYDNNPAHTHAWFVGWQGDVAFAVFVEKGGSSSATAVPIADRFLRALAAR